MCSRWIYWVLPFLILRALHTLFHLITATACEAAALILFNRYGNWGKKLSDKFPNKWFEPNFVLIPKSDALTALLTRPSCNISLCPDGIEAVLLLFYLWTSWGQGMCLTYFCVLSTKQEQALRKRLVKGVYANALRIYSFFPSLFVDLFCLYESSCGPFGE